MKTQCVCYIELDREAGYLIKLNKEAGLLHTDKKGGRVIAYRQTNLKGLLLQMNCGGVGLADLSRSSLYRGAVFKTSRGWKLC